MLNDIPQRHHVQRSIGQANRIHRPNPHVQPAPLSLGCGPFGWLHAHRLPTCCCGNLNKYANVGAYIEQAPSVRRADHALQTPQMIAKGHLAAEALLNVCLIFDGRISLKDKLRRPARVGIHKATVTTFDDLGMMPVARMGASKGFDAQGITLCRGRIANAILVPAAQITIDFDHYQ